MGNCLNTTTGCRRRSSSSYAGQKQQQVNPEDGLGSPAAEQRTGEEGGAGGPAGGLKVKVVLTRGELEWLMAQLKSGEKRLEDVLHEMGRDRLRAAAAAAAATGDGEGWRPSLESIVEGPEAAA